MSKVKYTKRVATLDEGLLNPEAEEGKSEINDVNNDNIRVAPNLQKHANSKTSSNQVSSNFKLENIAD